jgi:hypothetical protein
MVKTEKGGLFHGSGHAVGRGRIGTQLIFSHLQGADMSYRFKYTKDLGAGDKMVCIVKQFSHRCGLVGLMTGWWGWQSWSGKWSGGLVQFWEVITWRE